jgi:hypothetical protein
MAATDGMQEGDIAQTVSLLAHPGKPILKRQSSIGTLRDRQQQDPRDRQPGPRELVGQLILAPDNASGSAISCQEAPAHVQTHPRSGMPSPRRPKKQGLPCGAARCKQDGSQQKKKQGGDPSARPPGSISQTDNRNRLGWGGARIMPDLGFPYFDHCSLSQ